MEPAGVATELATGGAIRAGCDYPHMGHILRHNAVLIMSLLRLMKDAGIEALILNADAKLQVNE